MQVGKSNAPYPFFFFPSLIIVCMLLQLPYKEANVKMRARLTALTIPIKKRIWPQLWKGAGWSVRIEGISSTLKLLESITGWELEYFSSKLQAVGSLSGSQLCFNYVQWDQHIRCCIARANQWDSTSILCWCNMMVGGQVVTLAPKAL